MRDGAAPAAMARGGRQHGARNQRRCHEAGAQPEQLGRALGTMGGICVAYDELYYILSGVCVIIIHVRFKAHLD